MVSVQKEGRFPLKKIVQLQEAHAFFHLKRKNIIVNM